MVNEWLGTCYAFTPPESRRVCLDLPERLRIDHYINEQGYYVFTERAHLRRGVCCGSGCLHCPFEPRGRKGATTPRTEIREAMD